MTTLERTMERAKARKPVDAAAIEPLAAEYAGWRLGGCPGESFAARLKAKVGPVAKAYGRSYSDVWALVHRRAYEMIDAAEAARRP